MAKPESAKEKSRIEPSTTGVRRRKLIHSLLVVVSILGDLATEDGNYVCVQVIAREVSGYQSGHWNGRVGKRISTRNQRKIKKMQQNSIKAEHRSREECTLRHYLPPRSV